MSKSFHSSGVSTFLFAVLGACMQPARAGWESGVSGASSCTLLGGEDSTGLALAGV